MTSDCDVTGWMFVLMLVCLEICKEKTRCIKLVPIRRSI